MSRVAVGRVPRRERCWHIHWGRIQERRRWHSLLNVRRDTIRSVSRTYVPVIVRRVVRRWEYYGNICARNNLALRDRAANITCTHMGTNKCGLYKTIGARLSRVCLQLRQVTWSMRFWCGVSESARALFQTSWLVSLAPSLIIFIISHKVSAPRAFGGVRYQ